MISETVKPPDKLRPALKRAALRLADDLRVRAAAAHAYAVRAALAVFVIGAVLGAAMHIGRAARRRRTPAGIFGGRRALGVRAAASFAAFHGGGAVHLNFA